MTSNNAAEGVNGALGKALGLPADCDMLFTAEKDPNNVADDDAVCQALDEYTASKSCFVQVQRYKFQFYHLLNFLFLVKFQIDYLGPNYL